MASTQDSENVRSLILAVLSGISAAASQEFLFFILSYLGIQNLQNPCEVFLIIYIIYIYISEAFAVSKRAAEDVGVVESSGA